MSLPQGKDPFSLFIKKQNKRIPADLSRSEEKDDRIRGREEKMKETGRIKLKEIPFSRTFETGNGEELCNATGYAVQFDNEKTPLGFPLFWNEFQDREGNLYYGN